MPQDAPDPDDVMTLRVAGCARCGGTHASVAFERLHRPICNLGKPNATHWAPCPTNGQPILMAKLEEDG